MTTNDRFGLGAVYLEDSHLGLRSNFFTETEIVEFNPSSRVVAETTDSNPFYLKTSRSFQRWGWFSTRMTYKVEFEPAFIEATVGVPLPDALVEFYYNIRMNEYLIRLKFLLETRLSFWLSRS